MEQETEREKSERERETGDGGRESQFMGEVGAVVGEEREGGG